MKEPKLKVEHYDLEQPFMGLPLLTRLLKIGNGWYLHDGDPLDIWQCFQLNIALRYGSRAVGRRGRLLTKIKEDKHGTN